MSEQFLTVTEFARVFNYSDRSVRNMLNDGTIKGSRLGHRGKWCIPESEVERFKVQNANRQARGMVPLANEQAPPTEQATNWIDDYESKQGDLLPIPKWLAPLVGDYSEGARISKTLKLKIPSSQI
jgi:excisionase family DNA binding protein